MLKPQGYYSIQGSILLLVMATFQVISDNHHYWQIFLQPDIL
jgi:hypothetical protein